MLVSIAGAYPFAYITNRGGTVSVIDTATNKVTATINVGSGPQGVAVNPAGTKVYVTNYYNKTVSIIDTATNKVTAKVTVGGYPYGVAVNPDGKKVYVTNIYSRTVSVIDTATNNVTATINGFYKPIGIVVNPTGTKVYVTNYGDKTVSVIDAATNTVTATVTVGSRPWGVAVNPAGTKVYVTNDDDGTVSVIDTATNTIKATVTVGSKTYPWGIAVNPDGTKVYITSRKSKNVFVIDTATNKVTAKVTVGKYPYGVAVNPAGTKVYVANRDSTVSVIDTATNKVTASVKVGIWPIAFGQFIFTFTLAPFADFSAKPTEEKAPLTVTFTDESLRSPTKWKWSFGDGTTSTKQNPTHKYSKLGRYTVTLTATNDNGSNTVTKTEYIKVVTKPVANFTSSVTSGKTPLNVKFTDVSTGTPTKWQWDFGDGSKSFLQNPIHKYSKAGIYTVSLTVKNAAGRNTVTKTDYITVIARPVAAFSGSPTSGAVPLNVKFTDTSTGSPLKWKWSFGDGATSTQQSPRHKYSKVGRYTVTLTAINGNGSDMLTKTDYITVIARPVANFTSSVTSGKTPFNVVFTDTSTGIPAEWQWDFGDGSKSFLQNPIHKYSKAGIYTVSLTVKNAAGRNTVTKTDYITVIARPVAAFSGSPTSGAVPLNVKFTDKSTGTPTKWKWTFGDGTSSTIRNPIHKYSKVGRYTVALTATNAAGINTITKTDYIKVTT
ncbi:PKD domain-containing protein [Methanosarcina barkeri]|nr:PKD domain-containing protein [Methanosarcina barkeri]